MQDTSPNDSPTGGPTPASNDLAALVADLNCDSSIKCRIARISLVKKGYPAVPALISAMQKGAEIVPLEAAKALGNIGGPQAVQALIAALEDERFEVRWEAAEALIHAGRQGIRPLLQALVDRGSSSWLREGAHHVFSELDVPEMHQSVIQPVLDAIDDEEARLETPVAAQKALESLGG